MLEIMGLIRSLIDHKEGSYCFSERDYTYPRRAHCPCEGTGTRFHTRQLFVHSGIGLDQQPLHCSTEIQLPVRTQAVSCTCVRFECRISAWSRLIVSCSFVNGGELFMHLQREGRFSEERSRFYAAELLLALEHLHAFNVSVEISSYLLLVMLTPTSFG